VCVFVTLYLHCFGKTNLADDLKANIAYVLSSWE